MKHCPHPIAHTALRSISGLLLLAGIGLSSSSCSDPGSAATSGNLATRVEALRDAHAAAEKNNAALLADYNAALAAKEEAKASITKEIEAGSGLELRRTELGDELIQVRDEFEAYKAKYREWVRPAAKGYIFPSLNTGDGDILIQAKITSLDASKVGLTTADAIKSVQLEKLPQKLRDQLGFDPSANTSGLSVLEKAEIAIREAQTERAQQSKKFKEMLRERNRLLDKEDALYADNLPIPKDLSEKIDSLQVDLTISNSRSAHLIKIMNWNTMLINNGGVPPKGPRPH